MMPESDNLMKGSSESFDVAIIGCGLSGLVSGLLLQQQGYEVVIIERRSSYGGLCGTFTIDGYEFVIACNDFGQGMVRMFEELDVPVSFKAKKTLVFHRDKALAFPLGLGALRLLPYAPDLLRFAWKLRQYRRVGGEHHDLEHFVAAAAREEHAQDLMKLPAYLMGVTPADFKVRSFEEEHTYGYGYMRPAAPVGGPQSLVDALARKFLEAGTILLSTDYLGDQREGGWHSLTTTAGNIQASAVLSTLERRSAYPSNAKEGMPISMLCIAVAKDLSFPEDIHTMVYYPPGISDWFGQLDAGHQPPAFGFHLFRSDLPEKPDHYTLGIYFYLPRGSSDPDAARMRDIESYIFSRAERMLPGLGTAVMYKRLITANAFSKIHGLSSRVTPVILPHGVEKAANYDPDEDIYYAGNSVVPPGDHAGAAILSARMAVDQITARLSSGLHVMTSYR